MIGPLLAAPDLREGWKESSTDRKRRIIETLWTITLRPSGRGNKRFNPDNVVIEPKR